LIAVGMFGLLHSQQKAGQVVRKIFHDDGRRRTYPTTYDVGDVARRLRRPPCGLLAHLTRSQRRGRSDGALQSATRLVLGFNGSEHVSSILSRLNRLPQLQASFVAGDPASGYYNDLRVELPTDDPAEARRLLRGLVADRERANHVTIAQLALGAWQKRGEDEAWLPVFADGAEWLAGALDDAGGLQYLFAMPHTFEISPPWYSAMAQGEAASVFVRAALTLGDSTFADAAERAIKPLREDSSIVAHTPEGPVLQEYPTEPPSHVLNGWMFALWGLYDVAKLAERSGTAAPEAQHAFIEGINALVRRVDLYDAGLGWSRYDLYPHRLTHVASPFYHRLHVALLKATADLTDEDVLRRKAAEWEASAGRLPLRTVAVARKVAFRCFYPRRPI
jgi:hypothetical protein